jgi:hypothetical protein
MARIALSLAAAAATALALATPATAQVPDQRIQVSADAPSVTFVGRIATLSGDTKTFAVTPGSATRLVFDVELWKATDIALALTLPDGSVLQAGGILSGQTRRSIAVENPRAGTYTLEIDGHVGDGAIESEFDGTARLELPARALPAPTAKKATKKRCAKKTRSARKAKRSRRACRR